MTTVHTLASGSSGNALLVSCDHTHLLVDAGISCRRIALTLRKCGLTPQDLDAILITHTHTDHIAGLQTLLKHTSAPVMGSEQTVCELAHRFSAIEARLYKLELCQPFALRHCTMTPFPTSHDAPGSCGYRIDTANGNVGILTDTGYVTDEAADILLGVDLAVLEANHDVECVHSNSYPSFLKQRILGKEGHLSNEDSARFAVTLAESGTQHLILAHLSHENNTPTMARNAVELALSAAGLTPALSVAPRDALSEPYPVFRRALCKK